MANKYANKFLDAEGVKYLWDKAQGIYIKQEPGKTLSDENYTTVEKQKLAGLTSYELPAASEETLGGIKIGTGLAIDENGIVSATGEAEAEVEVLTFSDLDYITKSPSTAAALAATITEGGEINLSGNVALLEGLVVTHDTILNLGGHTLTADFNDFVFTAHGARLTILNGTINSSYRIAQAIHGGTIVVAGGLYQAGDLTFASVGPESVVQIDSGSIISDKECIYVFEGGSLAVNGGAMQAKDGCVIRTNKSNNREYSTVTISGGRVIGQATTQGKASCGVLIANDDRFVMNSGEIISENGCGLLLRAGQAEISGGFITARGSGVRSVDAIDVSHSAVIYQQTAGYPNNDNMSLIISNGVFEGSDRSIEILSNEALPQVDITGGVFNPSY